MPTVTQQVSAVSDPGSAWTLIGTPVTALNDGVASTAYETAVAGTETSNYLELTFLAPSLAGSRIRAIRPVLRWLDSSADGQVAAAAYLDGANVSDPLAPISDVAAQTQETVIAAPTMAYKIIGGLQTAWSNADPAEYRLRIWNPTGNSWFLTEAQLEIVTSTDPGLTVASVSGLDSAYPSIKYSFDDPDTAIIDTPTAADLKVFNAGTTDQNGVAAGAAGFDPSLIGSDVPDIVALASFPSSIGPLSVGTYHAYARAAKNVAIQNQMHFSPWVSQQLDVTVVLSAAPQVTVTADDTLDRFQVVVDTPPPNLLTSAASKTESIVPFSASADWAIGLDNVGALTGTHSLIARALTTSAKTVHLLDAGYVAAEGGKAYSASVKIKGAARLWRIGIVFAASLDGPFGNWGVTSYGSDTLVNNGTFTEIKVENVVAPAGTNFAAIQVQVADTPIANQKWTLDEFQIHEGATVALWDVGAALSVGQPISGSSVDLQRSFDSGTTWADFKTGLVTFTATQTTVLDREVPSSTNVRYRARVNRATAISAYGGDNTDRQISIEKLWLRHPTDATQDISLDPIAAEHSIVQPFVELEPLGSDRAVILRGRARGDRGRVRAYVDSKQTYDRLRAIAGSGERVMIQDNLGQQWAVQLVGQPKLQQERRIDAGAVAFRFAVSVPWREIA